VTALAAPSVALLGSVAREDAEKRVRGCAWPVRLVGSTTRYNAATGEVVDRYSSSQELDGITYVRCGDRRASRCESCSREYKGDSWHLVTAGLVGGKGAPESVVSHSTTFVTLTPPSFGPVHGLRRGAPCRARRDRPVCPHGRPLYCLHRHREDEKRLGEPLRPDCYDYVGHVLWQWHAPELWRRFSITLGRTLARLVGVCRKELKGLAKVNYTKVAEFQARGLIHVHAVMRLDLVPLTSDEVRRFSAGSPDHVRAAVLVAAGTGLRQGALFGLTVDRIDFLRRELRVDRQLWTPKRGPAVLAPPKTSNSYRTVAMSSLVAAGLSAHLATFGPGPTAWCSTPRRVAWSSGPRRRRTPAAPGWRRASAASCRSRARRGRATSSPGGTTSVTTMRACCCPRVSVRLSWPSAWATTLKTLLRTYAHVIRQDDERVRTIVDGTLGGDAEDWLRTETG
jgi:integrase